jgi:hypothetical protein
LSGNWSLQKTDDRKDDKLNSMIEKSNVPKVFEPFLNEEFGETMWA